MNKKKSLIKLKEDIFLLIFKLGNFDIKVMSEINARFNEIIKHRQ